MEQKQPITRIAGIDVAKSKLDVAVLGLAVVLCVDNSPAGFAKLAAWLKREGAGLHAIG